MSATRDFDQTADELRAAERWDEDYHALQASLEEYVTDRLAPLSEALDRQPGGGAGGGWFRRWRAEVYFGITVVCLVLIWWRLPAAPGTGNAAMPAPGAEIAPPPESPAVPMDLDQPAAAWQALMRDDRQALAAWLSAASEARGLEEDQISPGQRARFARWAEAARQGRSLPEDQLAGIRIGLFEYLFARRFQDPERLAKARNQVDLRIRDGEYNPRALAALLSETELARGFEAPLDASDQALQTAVVRHWIRTRNP